MNGINVFLRKIYKVMLVICALFIVNSIYLSVAPGVTPFYYYNLLGHILVGFVFAAMLFAYGVFHTIRYWKPGTWTSIILGLISIACFLACAVTGIILTYIGYVESTRWMLYVHIISPCAGIILFAFHRIKKAVPCATLPKIPFWRKPVVAIAYSLVLAAIFTYEIAAVQKPQERAKGKPFAYPAANFGTAVGNPASPFFASSVTTASGKRIPQDNYTTSMSCGAAGCHPDVTRQWVSSAHRMAGLMDPFLKANILYNESRGSPRVITKFCFGCHMPGALVSGAADTGPMDENNPVISEGISCVGCHSIVEVTHLKGNSGYVLEDPLKYPFENDPSPTLREMGNTLIQSKPQLHKETYLKPLHLTPEFCGACHRVGIPAAANADVWKRGFDEYGSWQMGPWSKQSTRAFYDLKDAPKRCQDCHMPLVDSKDAGTVNGKVHDHSFPAANTALSTVHGDSYLTKKHLDFLQQNRLSVDVFGFQRSPEGVSSENSELVSAIQDGDAVVEGEEVRLEVVVRARVIGHQFDAGTRDNQEPFVELTVSDSNGKALLVSGKIDRDGYLDPDAHVYRAYFNDRAGNVVGKRNAALDYITFIYSRHIEPGQCEVVHYRFKIPAGTGGKLKIQAALKYRKWNQWFYNWAMKGFVAPEDAATTFSALVDPRKWIFGSAPLPDLPIALISESSVTLNVLNNGSTLSAAQRKDEKTRDRIYDYAVGLYIQRNLDAAESAFRKAIEISPDFANAYVAIGRVLIDRGKSADARDALLKAIQLRPGLPRAHYFLGVALQQLGLFDESLAALAVAEKEFPRDRFLLLDIGKTYFYQGKLDAAKNYFTRVLDVDPEEYLGLYWMMRVSKAMGNEAEAKKWEALQLEYRYQPNPQNPWLTGSLSIPSADEQKYVEARPVHDHHLAAQGSD